MSSENKTPNIGLNQWQGNEYSKREDFVNDNLIIDSEIKDLKDEKVDKISGKRLSTEDYTTEERQKLANIADNANNYKHPLSHPASMITQDATHRFTTDQEKAYWNGLEALLKAYADAAAAGIVNSAPKTLDTLNELAQALGDDPNFATTMTNHLSNKVDNISGKGLSSNDYTAADKNKLNGIQSGAQVNRPISDSVNSTSTSTNASSKAVKSAYDKGVQALNTAITKEPSFNKNTGFNLNKSDSVNSTSTSTLATSKAVKTAYDKGNSAYSKVTSATYLRDRIKTVDGSGSGLDADTLDGKHANEFKPKFRGALVAMSANFSAPSETSIVAFDEEIYDTDGFHNNINNTRLTVPYGVSKIKISFNFYIKNTVSHRIARVYIMKNGSFVSKIGLPSVGDQHADNIEPTRLNASSAVLEVKAGDYFEIAYYFQEYSTTIIADETWFSIEVIE